MTAPAPTPAPVAAPAKAPSAKRAKKVVDTEGIAHISATFNNLLITITDMRGNTLAWGSAGKAGFKGSKKSTPFAATVAAENCGREAMNLGLRRVHVRVQGPGSGRESAIQALASVGLRWFPSAMSRLFRITAAVRPRSGGCSNSRLEQHTK